MGGFRGVLWMVKDGQFIVWGDAPLCRCAQISIEYSDAKGGLGEQRLNALKSAVKYLVQRMVALMAVMGWGMMVRRVFYCRQILFWIQCILYSHTDGIDSVSVI